MTSSTPRFSGQMTAYEARVERTTTKSLAIHVPKRLRRRCIRKECSKGELHPQGSLKVLSLLRAVVIGRNARCEPIQVQHIQAARRLFSTVETRAFGPRRFAQFLTHSIVLAQ